MSRQKPDIFETHTDIGPLFSTPEKHLSGNTDPQTSRDAARLAMGSLGNMQRWALELVQRYPGQTCKALATLAIRDGDFPGPFKTEHEYVRQRIGRRLNELEKAGLIRRDGVRDGCSVWWPV